MSQQQGTTSKINEHEYTMYMLPPMASHDLFVDVLKMVGPSIGPVIDALLQGGKFELADFMQQELGADFFSKAASALFGGLDKKILRDCIKAFGDVTHVDDMPLAPIFDRHFQGELGAMYQWLLWGMRVQWGKSLSALGSVVVAQGAAAMTGAK